MLRSDVPVAAANAVTFGLVLTLIIAKYTVKAPVDPAPDEPFWRARPGASGHRAVALPSRSPSALSVPFGTQRTIETAPLARL